ncbi:MAG: D-glycerate dehydrogenase [Candidatus Uhrbacteria bacterium]|nr:D-glycerate dehydrogenase [Patescibacteria group bacterium]MBU1906556.1 D-glycerate dehydrogenase [Patescibacteria group bacterium]
MANKKIKVFVTRQIPDEGIKMLKKRKNIQVSIYKKDRKIPRAELLRRVKGIDVLISLLTERIDAKVFDAAGPNLKMVANYAVGFDNIDLAEAAKRGIAVSNTPSAEVSETVAEHTVALLFALAHRIVEVDNFTREGKYHGWGPQMFLGQDVIGKTLGVIGTGRIGTHLVRRMHDGFGLNIVYTDIARNKDLEKKYGAKYLSKMQLLKKADFVSLHVPLLPSTRHLISTKELKAMKPNALLINTSRGPVIDELALVKALEKKQIAGAGLDVYECEPAIDCDLSDTHELRKLNNVILTPHTASATIEARQAMSRTAAVNVLAYLDGKRMPNRVRPKK